MVVVSRNEVLATPMGPFMGDADIDCLLGRGLAFLDEVNWVLPIELIWGGIKGWPKMVLLFRDCGRVDVLDGSRPE